MILNLSILKVCDNSGIKHVKCFKVYKGFVGIVGSMIYASIKDSKSKSKLRKGEIIRGIVVRKKKMINRNNGNYLSFDSNEVVLLNDKYELLGTRIFGPMPLELRKKRHLKLLSLASSLV